MVERPPWRVYVVLEGSITSQERYYVRGPLGTGKGEILVSYVVGIGVHVSFRQIFS